MKASDSTTSLTALNEKIDQVCFICLDNEHDTGEPLVDSKLLRNCGCRFYVHPPCWNIWLRDKSDYDCPICRKESVVRIRIPNPSMEALGTSDIQTTGGLSAWNKTYLCMCLCLLSTGIVIGLISGIVFYRSP